MGDDDARVRLDVLSDGTRCHKAHNQPPLSPKPILGLISGTPGAKCIKLSRHTLRAKKRAKCTMREGNGAWSSVFLLQWD